MNYLVEGTVLGLTLAGSCLATCGPIYAPYMMMEDRSFTNNLKIAFQISLGRFLTYAAFGAMAGFLGQQLSDDLKFKATGISYILLSVFLAIYMFGHLKPKHNTCSTKKWAPLAKDSPLMLGVITGISFCPSFLIALTAAFKESGVLNGMLFFLAFFIGTSIIILPISFMGFLPGLKIKHIKKVGYIATILVVTWFSIQGSLMTYTAFTTGSHTYEEFNPLKIAEDIVNPATMFSMLNAKDIYILANQGEEDFANKLKEEIGKKGVSNIVVYNGNAIDAVEKLKSIKSNKGVLITKSIFQNEFMQKGILSSNKENNNYIIGIASPEAPDKINDTVNDTLAKLDFYTFKIKDKGFLFQIAN